VERKRNLKGTGEEKRKLSDLVLVILKGFLSNNSTIHKK
jgi:hypothetical protein